MSTKQLNSRTQGGREQTILTVAATPEVGLAFIVQDGKHPERRKGMDFMGLTLSGAMPAVCTNRSWGSQQP